MTTKYFKSIVEDRNGKTHSIRGTAFIDLGQTIEGQILHIALVQGLGKVEIKSIKEYSSGEEWYEAQYGKKHKSELGRMGR